MNSRTLYSSDKKRRGRIVKHGRHFKVITERRRLTLGGSEWEPRWPLFFRTRAEAESALKRWNQSGALDLPAAIVAGMSHGAGGIGGNRA